jgi:hypothetical protein
MGTINRCIIGYSWKIYNQQLIGWDTLVINVAGNPRSKQRFSWEKHVHGQV